MVRWRLEVEVVGEVVESDLDYYNLQLDSSQEVEEEVEMTTLETKTALLLEEMDWRMAVQELYQIVFETLMLEMVSWR